MRDLPPDLSDLPAGAEFVIEPDGDGEPTLWLRPADGLAQAILCESDLAPTMRRIGWAFITHSVNVLRAVHDQYGAKPSAAAEVSNAE